MRELHILGEAYVVCILSEEYNKANRPKANGKEQAEKTHMRITRNRYNGPVDSSKPLAIFFFVFFFGNLVLSPSTSSCFLDGHRKVACFHLCSEKIKVAK